jgi:hypothetical protein
VTAHFTADQVGQQDRREFGSIYGLGFEGAGLRRTRHAGLQEQEARDCPFLATRRGIAASDGVDSQRDKFRRSARRRPKGRAYQSVPNIAKTSNTTMIVVVTEKR